MDQFEELMAASLAASRDHNGFFDDIAERQRYGEPGLAESVARYHSPGDSETPEGEQRSPDSGGRDEHDAESEASGNDSQA